HLKIGFTFFELADTFRQIRSQVHPPGLVGDRIGSMYPRQQLPVCGGETGFFQQLALRGGEKFFSRRRPAFRYFPRMFTERKAELADEPGVAVGVYRDNAYRAIFEVNFSVTATASSRVNHLVFRNPDPRVLILFF